MTRLSSYAESMALLDQLYRRPLMPASQAGLRRIRTLLACLGSPERRFRSVHVAGSSGKGSTSTMLGAILTNSGIRTGIFRSPHLHSYRERISIGADIIDRDSWSEAFSQVWTIVERMSNNSLPSYSLGRPALFEVLFAMMAVHFARQEIPWAVVETGLGGRLDATNVLPAEVAMITNISLEHTQILGGTVSKIAAEKAAIIKTNAWVVSGATEPASASVISKAARDAAARLLQLERDYNYQLESISLDGQCIQIVLPDETYAIEQAAIGSFQAANASASAAAAYGLRKNGVEIETSVVRATLAKVTVPGRFEVIRRDPVVILDGAHNPAAAEELSRTLDLLFAGQRCQLVFSALSDKNIAAMAASLGPRSERVFLTSAPGTDRSAATDVLSQAFRPHCSRITESTEPESALSAAMSSAGIDGHVVVAGSMYLVGYVRNMFSRSREVV